MRLKNSNFLRAFKMSSCCWKLFRVFCHQIQLALRLRSMKKLLRRVEEEANCPPRTPCLRMPMLESWDQIKGLGQDFPGLIRLWPCSYEKKMVEVVPALLLSATLCLCAWVFSLQSTCHLEVLPGWQRAQT